MKKISCLSIFLIAATAVCTAQASKSKLEVDYVNPLIVTPYAGFKKGLDGGGTVPAVGWPYAMTNFLAQTAEPEMGINGNEDCGQMAAWYIFGVMGFYPVTPASGIYAIGAPQYPKLTLNYKANNQPKTFTISANNISEENKYIQSVKLDGKPVNHPFISHAEIVGGHQLIFEMGLEPNKDWK